ncbi:universal stress protein [Streptosporangium fragile]|uniref:Universal stress protein n=1 Tax=Streptosporangium fragile TaxID=46186 RepID=A0ABN3W8S1_9ACTN
MIVVGVDGSWAGLEAVDWAMREAGLRGTGVRVVTVVPAWAYETPEDRPHAYVGRCMRENAASVLADARRRASGVSRAEAEFELLRDDPQVGLIRASKDAELLVIGSRGLGGFQELLIGSVALGVSGQANCPVVVVHQMPRCPRDEVVVGVDGSPGGTAAIEFAFAEADLRGADLLAVHAWDRPAAGAGRAASSGRTGAERALPAEAVAGRSERHPGVKIVEHVERGHPVEVLRRVSAGAGLLVVGSRGRGAVAGLFLGSVSCSLLRRVDCPLVIVPVADGA